MLSVYADQHREAPFPKKAYKAELQKTTENAGLGLQVSEFLSEAEIIHSLYYRYRNAHHCAEWFRPFSMLHRRVSQVANWIVDLHKATKKRVPRLITAIKISIQKIQTRYLQPAFWSFYSVLALGQYVTVGFALLGTVARIASLLAQVHPIPRTVGKVLDAAVKKGAEVMSDDIGEVLVRVTSEKPAKSDKIKKMTKSTVTKTTTGGKKLLKNMDIDDIFSTKKKTKKNIEKSRVVEENVEESIITNDDIEDNSMLTEPAPKAKKVKVAKVENFFEESKDKKKKNPAFLDDSLEPPKKKKKILDSTDGMKKKKKKSKKNAIDDIFG